MPTFKYEREAWAQGLRVVVGIDEAGRGPLAGPVVAAAVVLPEKLPRRLSRRIDDSKKLAPEVREELFQGIAAVARFAVGHAEVAEIDTHNILAASMLAMGRALTALGALGARADLALVDGDRSPKVPCRVRCVVGGDGICLSIAAASIVAKVTRDRLMRRLAVDYPGYGFERHMGYATPEHLAALARLGATPHHRKTFQPVVNILSREAPATIDVGQPSLP